MPVHTYTNWNSRPSDREEQVEPYRKYYFICEGANTETFYFEKLIDLRKDLGIHPLIDIRLWEKTEGDRNISFAKNLVRFAYEQKSLESNGFDVERDKMIIVFDGDIFEEKVQGYDELIASIEENDIAAVSNPGFELFLLLHVDGSYEKYIEISFKDTFTFELKKYGQGKFNKYKLIDEKQVDAAVIEEMFDCMQTKDESYLIIKEPQKIDKHIEILEELKNDK